MSGSGQPSSSSKPSLSSGSFGALVLIVGDAVLVVVGIGAAVVVLEAVLVLGLVAGTCRGDRGCDPRPCPSSGQPFTRSSAEGTPRSAGHASRSSGTPSPSRRRRGSRSSSVLRRPALHAGARVVAIDDAVVVVVDLRAAVLVLEAVAVLGDSRALIEIVVDAVLVLVVIARRPAHGEDTAKRRHAHGLREADVDAGEQVRVLLPVEGVAVGEGEHHRRQRRSAVSAEGRHRVQRQPAAHAELPALPVLRIRARARCRA